MLAPIEGLAWVGLQILDDGHRRDRSGRNPARKVGEEDRDGRDQGAAHGQLDARHAEDRAIHEEGQVAILRELHDDLDAAVSEAYGWPANLSTEEGLARLTFSQ